MMRIPFLPDVDESTLRRYLITGIAVLLAFLLAWALWWHYLRSPWTRDGRVRAEVVNIATEVSGKVFALEVVDNQTVKKGDILFEIDPADYQLALANAEASLATLDRQIEVGRANDDELKFEVKAAAAGVEQAKAELKQATNTLSRLEPLLPQGFAVANDVDKAQTAVSVATASLAQQEQRLNQAKTSLSNLATLLAQRPGAAAAVDLAKLDLSYCKVIAPFPGRIINFNLSVGAYASVGVPLFSLLDTRKWYVIANFREGELRHLAPGAVMDVYLLSAPKRRFTGIVQGIGWAVDSSDEIDISHGVPDVPRELNWVHIAQRFPVRIQIENPDPDLFRKGASATAILARTK